MEVGFPDSGKVTQLHRQKHGSLFITMSHLAKGFIGCLPFSKILPFLLLIDIGCIIFTPERSQ